MKILPCPKLRLRAVKSVVMVLLLFPFNVFTDTAVNGWNKSDRIFTEASSGIWVDNGNKSNQCID